jgi:hypothetical protein
MVGEPESTKMSIKTYLSSHEGESRQELVDLLETSPIPKDQ